MRTECKSTQRRIILLRKSPRILYLWILWLVLANCLETASVSGAEVTFQGEKREKTPGTWRTLILTSEDQFRPPPPPADTQILHNQLDAVISKQYRITPEWKDRIAYWDERLVTHRWTELSLEKIAKHNLSPVRASRAIALLHVAMYDAIVASWDAKYIYKKPSPVHASRSVKPMVEVPKIPSYPSEHAAVAEAAAAVLSYPFWRYQ